MTGTRWTEPGQGATMRDLNCAKDPIGAEQGAYWKFDTSGEPRTNLALTGEPLTAEDVANIGRAK
jgi:hypothetical protein